jgi:hypothetical protein
MKSDLLPGACYGKLTILREGERSKYARQFWVLCACGVERLMSAHPIHQGRVVSCGCHGRLILGETSRRHGQTRSPTYKVWENLRRRTRRVNGNRAHRYIAQGISFDPAWASFEVFLAEMGERPKGKSIDRIDNSRGYSKENCRWATPTEQARNRVTNRVFTYRGVDLCLAALAQLAGLPAVNVRQRLRIGWLPDRAFGLAGVAEKPRKDLP